MIRFGMGGTYPVDGNVSPSRPRRSCASGGVALSAMDSDPHLEEQLQAIGRQLHAALPPRTRHPVRALDAKAMELASRDAELRAALFRLVDVTPVCRSLDDLARHLAGYLEELGERPPSVEAAMRASHSAAGRRALGAAAAGGVRHMAHRFIVGDS